MNTNECLILDDDELERPQAQKEEVIHPRDMRTWLPETLNHQNPFNSTYVSTSHAFPKVFQMKSGQKEEFPKLSERIIPVPSTTMNYRSRLLQKSQQLEKISTINVLERVREVLQESNDLIHTENNWTVTCDQPQSPRYSPHTPPYPFDSPVLFTAIPPMNELIYPTAITPPPSSS
jgi:hypothetical protein